MTNYIKLQSVIGLRVKMTNRFPMSTLGKNCPYKDFGFYSPRCNNYENCKEIAADWVKLSHRILIKVGASNKNIPSAKLRLIRNQLATMERGRKRKTRLTRVDGYQNLLLLEVGTMFATYEGGTFLLSLIRHRLGHGNKTDKFIVSAENRKLVVGILKEPKSANKLKHAYENVSYQEDQGSGIATSLELISSIRKILPTIFK